MWQAAAAWSLLLLFVGSGRRRRHLPSGSAPFMASHLLRLQTALTRLAASRVSGAGALLAPPLSPQRMPIGLVAKSQEFSLPWRANFYVWKFFHVHINDGKTCIKAKSATFTAGLLIHPRLFYTNKYVVLYHNQCQSSGVQLCCRFIWYLTFSARTHTHTQASDQPGSAALFDRVSSRGRSVTEPLPPP